MTVREYAERQSGLKRQFTVRKDIVRLMSQVVICSNFVVVTPSIAASEPYQAYNNQCARAVILDEAAAMHRTDGLIVYWNTPRPMIVVGDEKQLVPTLVTANQKDETGNDINRFGDDARVSFLSWWLHLGFPAFHLYKQYRMARGMFVLSLEFVLQVVVNEFKYAESCELTNFSYAGDIQAYLQHTANLVLPADTMSPVFINCHNCVDSVSQSRYNARAVECMVKWLRSFIGALGVPTDRIAAITPYRANLQHIRFRFSAELTLERIEVPTIDTFMGREADIVLLCPAVDKESGPGFTAHPQRLNVAITRHQTALFVVGDIDTIPAPDSGRPKRPRTEGATAEDGASVKVNLRMMTKMFQWFRDNGMIIHLQGDPNVDPDA
ncbi:AAA-12 domain-containing protein [Fusarium keratoplasticum]|uniref:AAA-12 domain-containing protein n=1 Tax=Fusarium keratoplasticum TaxID=1328300 RepID=A0ACC0R7K9_9HYPO|nr:AAA-12 domain-containing protein [Fusarium keratoplasticum]KAI8679149.1 AAA-12 domain-containing protein [Fusarium keratoplasticum]